MRKVNRVNRITFVNSEFNIINTSKIIPYLRSDTTQNSPFAV